MNHRNVFLLGACAVAGVALCGLTASRAHGQPPATAGGNPQKHLPIGQRLVSGKIAAGDANAGTITVTTQIGTMQVIRVTQDTTMQIQKTVLMKDLQIGDELQVMGVPTGITANNITAGTPPAFLGGRGRGALLAPGGRVLGNQPVQDANGNVITPPPASAMAYGKVVGVSPLIINIAENMDVVLKAGHDVTVTRYEPIPFGNLKAGDELIASGQMNEDGTCTASSIGINIQTGNAGGIGFRPGRSNNLNGTVGGQ